MKKANPNILTVNESVKKSQEEGIPITETALRRWIKTGEVRAVYAGRKALIYWPNLVQFITGKNQPTHDNPAA